MQKISYLLMAILVLAVAVGCKSAPPPEEPEVEAPAADEADQLDAKGRKKR